GMVEARMIERVAAIVADRFAERWPGVEHQDGAALRMRGEGGKHGALGVGRKMEETVPRQNAVETPAELKLAHGGDDPFLLRHAVAAQGNQALRTVDTGHAHAVRDKIASDR